MKRAVIVGWLALFTVFLWAGDAKTEAHAVNAMTVAEQSHEADRLEGEKRYRTNCGRCHQAPHKYPPRMMATFIRHMRVRANITNEDMQYIQAYMTQ